VRFFFKFVGLVHLTDDVSRIDRESVLAPVIILKEKSQKKWNYENSGKMLDKIARNLIVFLVFSWNASVRPAVIKVIQSDSKSHKKKS